MNLINSETQEKMDLSLKDLESFNERFQNSMRNLRFRNIAISKRRKIARASRLHRPIPCFLFHFTWWSENHLKKSNSRSFQFLRHSILHVGSSWNRRTRRTDLTSRRASSILNSKTEMKRDRKRVGHWHFRALLHCLQLLTWTKNSLSCHSAWYGDSRRDN